MDLAERHVAPQCRCQPTAGDAIISRLRLPWRDTWTCGWKSATRIGTSARVRTSTGSVLFIRRNEDSSVHRLPSYLVSFCAVLGKKRQIPEECASSTRAARGNCSGSEPREKAAPERDRFFSGLLGNQSMRESFFTEEVRKERATGRRWEGGSVLGKRDIVKKVAKCAAYRVAAILENTGKMKSTDTYCYEINRQISATWRSRMSLLRLMVQQLQKYFSAWWPYITRCIDILWYIIIRYIKVGGRDRLA